ncbi:MAG: O-antigen ligase [Halioglobus sp.]|jgi:putative inorganic carbon (HCO3(-)) transporter
MMLKDDPKEGADRYLFLGFLLLLVWLPLPVGSNHLWAWSFFEVGVFALAIYWLVLFTLGKVSTTLTFRKAWPALFMFAMVLLWSVLQIAPLPPSLIALLSPDGAEIYIHTNTNATLSLDPAAGRAAVLKTLAYGLLFALTLLVVNQLYRLRLVMLVLIFSGVFQATFGSLMTLSGLEYGFFISKAHNIGVATGTFVNPNHLAGYLEMCLALGVGMVLADITTTPSSSWRESVRRLLNTLLNDKGRVRIALIIMVIGLVLSKSRMGNIAFFTSLLVAGGYYIVVGRRVSSGIIAFFVSILLVDILIVGNIFGINNVAEEIWQTSVATEASRIDVGRDTLNMIRDYPLTGTGAGSFASTLPMYDSGNIGFWHYKYAHNDYLQFAAELGLPGLAMLAGVVLLSLWHAARAQLIPNDQMTSGMGCGVLMAIIALLIHITVDFNLQIPANAATFVVILAMAWHTRWLAEDEARTY